MKLVVGLGNPGKEYSNTRHNVGYIVIDSYIDDDKWKEKFNALYYEKSINGEKTIFVKPLTYMNLSGDSVVQFVTYYHIELSDILVVQDDLDIEIGRYKLKTNSSDGGHNGIKSIINRLNSNRFARLKVGISNNKNIDTKDYVLGKFNKEEIELLNNMQVTFNKIITCFIKEGIDRTMNIYNSKK